MDKSSLSLSLSQIFVPKVIIHAIRTENLTNKWNNTTISVSLSLSLILENLCPTQHGFARAQCASSSWPIYISRYSYTLRKEVGMGSGRVGSSFHVEALGPSFTSPCESDGFFVSFILLRTCLSLYACLPVSPCFFFFSFVV